MDIRKKILQRQDDNLNDLFKNSKISILGLGGLGSNIAMLLARSGIGKLNLFDFDKIEYSNLNRQNYFVEDIGQKKTQTCKKMIKRAIPYVDIETFDIYLDKNSMDKFLDKSDIFIEAFDNKESKRFVFEYFLDHPEKELLMASGLSGLGDLEDIRIKKIKNITMIGDFKSEPKAGLFAPYLMTVASLQALYALKIIRRKNARYLGEIALVPYDSPISNSNILFYNTLFDENASCHFALGKAYPTTVKGAADLDDSEIEKVGLNDSLIHEDFMVGAKDLNITGYKNDEKFDIFVDGNWA